jgi:hypothetical protein
VNEQELKDAVNATAAIAENIQVLLPIVGRSEVIDLLDIMGLAVYNGNMDLLLPFMQGVQHKVAQR